MAIFKKKTSDEEKGKNGEPAAVGDSFTPQPDKARKWISHAKTAAESNNYDYALSCFAHGIRLDPEAMSAHEEMYAAAVKYSQKGGKAASSKEIKSIDDGTPMAKMAAAEYAWMKDLANGALALKAIEAAIKAEQLELGNWMAAPTLNALRRSKKLSKSHLLSAKELFATVNAWNEAITAGEHALQLDPNDNDLAADLKDLAAQRAMDQGGYNEAGGVEGGFRKYIKDADQQRDLQESEAISGAESVEERNLLRAEHLYKEAPDVPDNISRYAQILKKQGTPEMEQKAYALYMKGFETLGEYRFRMSAGDIQIDQAKRKVRAVQNQIESNGASDELQSKLDGASRALLELESSEYRERVSKYPTDRPLKYQLGVVEFQLENFNEAMECFQKAKDEPKLRVRAGHMLGRCFAKEDWHSDAIAEYQEALGSIDVTEEQRELDIRYDLMLSLIAHASLERSIDMAKEARDVCSTIARKNISYRDIRDRRKQIEELVKELSVDGSGNE